MPDPVTYFWIAVAGILVLLDLWAIISVFRSSKSVETKALWALGISLFPVLGLVYWGIAGPRAPGPGPRPVVPGAQQVVPCRPGPRVRPVASGASAPGHRGCRTARCPGG